MAAMVATARAFGDSKFAKMTIPPGSLQDCDSRDVMKTGVCIAMIPMELQRAFLAFSSSGRGGAFRRAGGMRHERQSPGESGVGLSQHTLHVNIKVTKLQFLIIEYSNGTYSNGRGTCEGVRTCEWLGKKTKKRHLCGKGQDGQPAKGRSKWPRLPTPQPSRSERPEREEWGSLQESREVRSANRVSDSHGGEATSFPLPFIACA